MFYRGAMNKLCRFKVSEIEHPRDAIAAVEDFVKDDPFFHKPVLALIQGGKA